MRRFTGVLLTLLLLLQVVPIPAAAASYSFTFANGVISMEKGDAVSATCILEGSTGGTYGFSCNFSQSPQIGLPIRRLPLDNYRITVTFLGSEGQTLSTKVGQYTLGADSPVAAPDEQGTPGANDPSLSRAVMAPYAKIYSSGGLAGEPIGELKRHDIVNVLNISGNIAYVKAIIQSGNGAITNDSNIDATYHSPDDKIVYGYMDAAAFTLPLSSHAIDKQREVAELAYSRLGLRGVYSQSKRYIDYYLDCAALATWCWFQVGVDMRQCGTNCTGLTAWANQHSNTIIGEAEQSKVEPQKEIDNYKEALPDCLCLECGCEICVCDDEPEALEFGASKYGTIMEKNLVRFNTHVDEGIYASLEPGDLIFFNYKEDLTCQYEGIYSHTFSYRVNEANGGDKDGGYDHVAVFVGLKSPEVALIIESSSPSTDPGKNTKVTEMVIGGAKANSVGKIVRPANAA